MLLTNLKNPHDVCLMKNKWKWNVTDFEIFILNNMENTIHLSATRFNTAGQVHDKLLIRHHINAVRIIIFSLGVYHRRIIIVTPKKLNTQICNISYFKVNIYLLC